MRLTMKEIMGLDLNIEILYYFSPLMRVPIWGMGGNERG